MPYAIEGSGSKFIVKNKKTGDIKGHFTSRKKALRQMRLLQGVEHGWKPTGKPAKAEEGAVVTLVTSRDLLRQGWEESYQDAQAD